MKSTINTELILTLDIDEVEWLREIMSDPIGTDDPINEHPLNRQMRMRFLTELQQFS